MGDGQKLKDYIYDKGSNVSKIAKETGISATTLYTIIQRDSNIRFDFALRLANALEIDVNEICSTFSEDIKKEEIYSNIPDNLNDALNTSRVNMHLKDFIYPLLHLFGPNNMSDVNTLLTSFYQLDDEARDEILQTMKLKLKYHRNTERTEQLEQIKTCNIP